VNSICAYDQIALDLGTVQEHYGPSVWVCFGNFAGRMNEDWPAFAINRCSHFLEMLVKMGSVCEKPLVLPSSCGFRDVSGGKELARLLDQSDLLQ
jgi:hypothetical protein